MMKQVIVMRTDLNMRKGKMIAQGAHASLKVTLGNLKHEHVQAWLSEAFTKIAVKGESEQQIKDLCAEAKNAGIVCALIVDAGRTEFNGVPTITCCAIGPGPVDEIDKITGHLSLL